MILHKNKEIPAFPSGTPQKLTNLAPNIPSTRLPMHKFGTCAQVVWRGCLFHISLSNLIWLDCLLNPRKKIMIM